MAKDIRQDQAGACEDLRTRAASTQDQREAAKMRVQALTLQLLAERPD